MSTSCLQPKLLGLLAQLPRQSAVRVVWQGSLIYKDQIADENDPLIDILLQSGIIILGKTNTPEFGAGANTFNKYMLCITSSLHKPCMLHLDTRSLWAWRSEAENVPAASRDLHATLSSKSLPVTASMQSRCLPSNCQPAVLLLFCWCLTSGHACAVSLARPAIPGTQG